MKKGFFPVLGVLLLAGLTACKDVKRGIPLKTPPPDDSYELATLVETLDGCEPGNDGCAYARAIFPQFHTPDAAFLNPVILSIVASEDMKPEYGTVAVADSITLAQKRFLADYATFKEDFPDDAQIWFRDVSVACSRPFSGFVSLSVTKVEYQGGANSNEKTAFFNYDLANKRQLQLQDVMVQDFHPLLLKQLETAFRKEKNLAPTDSLKKAQLFEEQFKMPQQFMLTAQGIRFLYNTYEIGPRTLGTVELLLTWEQLKGITTLQVLSIGT
jgi:hypothetical protein